MKEKGPRFAHGATFLPRDTMLAGAVYAMALCVRPSCLSQADILPTAKRNTAKRTPLDRPWTLVFLR